MKARQSKCGPRFANSANLPASTQVYCGHEYTQANAKFAKTIEPNNAVLTARCQDIDGLRARNLPTIPSRLDVELASNPFLRADEPSVAEALGMSGERAPVAIFTEIRKRKDNF